MPQMNKGGKFVFGESVIRPDGWVRLPPQAAEEYRIASEGKVYLFTGSKMTGGSCLSAAATSLLPWARKSRCWKRRRSWTVRYRGFEKSKACEQALTDYSHDRAFPMVCSKESGTPCMTAAYAVMHGIF